MSRDRNLESVKAFCFMETWKDVVGYEGIYKVSNLGNVKSLYFTKEKILKNLLGTSGYYNVNLYKNKKGIPVLVHRIVFEAFYNMKSNRKLVIDHIDSNKLNNNISNLQLVTNRFNSSKEKSNKSGHNNIYLNNKKYLIRLRINNKKYSIKTCESIEEAINVRNQFENNYLSYIETLPHNQIKLKLNELKKLYI